MPGPRFLITGCGCSGTRWVAKVLSALDVPCGHERVFRPGGVLAHRWAGGESSWLAVPHLATSTTWDVPAVRIVRDPFAAVNSAIADGFLVQSRRGVHDPFAAFVFKHQPDVAKVDDSIFAETSTAAARAIRWVTGWDAPAEHLPTFRVEDGADAIAGILDVIGVRRNRQRIVDRIAVLGTVNTHHRGATRRYTQAELLGLPDADLLADRATRLGYALR